MCGKAFRDVYHLNRHRLSHSDQKPFECPVCNQLLETCPVALATKDRLRTHTGRHEGKVRCDVCGKLLSAAYITSHLKTRGQSQGISCNTCEQGISRTCMHEWRPAARSSTLLKQDSSWQDEMPELKPIIKKQNPFQN
uniref:C2H2-type domain-containing protein n=1 Tax=Felis catus TaxID=9685 RepID=A0ABI7Y4W4_FELCA